MVRRHNGATGSFDRVFATVPNSDQATALSFGPDGRLYAGMAAGASVLRFDGATGAFTDVFIPGGFGGLATNITGLLFYPPSTQVTTSTITVTTLQNGQSLTGIPFTLTKDGVFYKNGATPFSDTAAPAGTYTITYGTLTGYITPPSETKTLAAGGTISFTGAYTPILLNAFPLSLTFSYQEGATGLILPKPVLLTSTGPALNFTAIASTTPSGGTWLSVLPNNGTTLSTLLVTVALGMSQGTYFGQIIVTAPGALNNPLVIPITLTVVPPSLLISPRSLSFTFVAGRGRPSPQQIQVSSNGTPLSFSVAATGSDGRWLFANPSAGTTPQNIAVTVSDNTLARGFPLGLHTGTVTITAPGAANSPQMIPVTLNVVSLPAILTLSPTTSSNTVGNYSQSFIAILTDIDGHPLPNHLVRFTVTGANSVYDRDLTTTKGIANFAYRANMEGVDNIVATTLVNGIPITSHSVKATWIPPVTLIIRQPEHIFNEPQSQSAFTLWGRIHDLALDEATSLGVFDGTADACYFPAIDATRIAAQTTLLSPGQVAKQILDATTTVAQNIAPFLPLSTVGHILVGAG